VKIFTVFGKAISTLIILGLALGILRFLTGVEVIKGLAPIEEGAAVCLNASLVMTGAFPLVTLLSRLLRRPLRALGRKLAINETSVMGIFGAMATSAVTFGTMKDMDRKGVVLSSAFSVSGAFVFAGHLAFTMAFDAGYVFPMIVGKLIAGVTALLLAMPVEKKNAGK
jgi:ethanolamine transporter